MKENNENKAKALEENKKNSDSPQTHLIFLVY